MIVCVLLRFRNACHMHFTLLSPVLCTCCHTNSLFIVLYECRCVSHLLCSNRFALSVWTQQLQLPQVKSRPFPVCRYSQLCGGYCCMRMFMYYFLQEGAGVSAGTCWPISLHPCLWLSWRTCGPLQGLLPCRIRQGIHWCGPCRMIRMWQRVLWSSL